MKSNHDVVLLDLANKLVQCERKSLSIIALLGCVATVATIFLYSSTGIHSVQYLRCVAPIFAAGFSILAKEDVLSWRLAISLSTMVIGLALAVWKVGLSIHAYFRQSRLAT